MVDADGLAGNALPCPAVDDIPDYPSVPVHSVLLLGEVLALHADMEGMGLALHGAQLAIQVFAINPDAQLIGVLGVVLDTIVHVVVRDTRARTKRYLTTEIREEVHPVVVMMLCNGELAMEHHPMDKVGQLAQTASDAFRWFALGDGQPNPEASPSGSPTYEFPDGERLTRTNQHTINTGSCQSKVDRLILLKLHIHITESAPYQGVVPIDQDGQHLARLLPCKTNPCKAVPNTPLQYLLLHREAIGEW